MNDDLISRQAAIDALGEEPEVWTDSDAEIAERNQWRMDVAAIKAVPSAPQKIAYLINPHPYGECSNCGQLIDIRDGYNYCPNCGYKLRGKRNET